MPYWRTLRLARQVQVLGDPTWMSVWLSSGAAVGNIPWADDLPDPRNSYMKNRDQVLALAAVMSCCQLVQRMARVGIADDNALARLVETALKFGVERPDSLYGGASTVAPGLRLIAELTSGRPGADELEVLRMAASVLKVQKNLRRSSELESELGRKLTALASESRSVPLPDSVYFAINDIYTDTVSRIRPRIVVNGSEGHLQSALVIAKVRSALLAAIRNAYLWHDLGGRQWHLLVYRKRFGEIARAEQVGRAQDSVNQEE